MWQAASERTPASWSSCPYVIPFPLLWAGPRDLFLRSNTWQEWWHVTFKITSQKTDYLSCFFLLPSCSHLSCPLACLFWWSVLLCCDLPCREIHMSKNQERSWNVSSLGTEALLPTTCEELNPDINLMSELGSRPFPSCTLRWLQSQLESWVQLVRDPETEDLSKPWLGNLRKLWGGNNSVFLSH